MAGYFELRRSTIDDDVGTVVKFLGDGVVAVFRVPEVAEDDILRAVAAGEAPQGGIRAFVDHVYDEAVAMTGSSRPGACAGGDAR